MIWNYFVYFALVAWVSWVLGALAAWKRRQRLATVCTWVGLAVFWSYILLMWMALERPPLRTMGETRMWYSFFLPLAGWLVYVRWRYPWILSFSALLSGVFIGVNLLRPEIHTKALMPALQSPWFAPHVIVYMFAYALLGAAALMAVYLLLARRTIGKHEMRICDNLVATGLSFLTIGMLFGALWANEAWGHYWGWDPKETWAAVTWLAYLVYVHFRKSSPRRLRVALWMLVIAFVALQMCWWGINYLPAARGMSIHTYS